MASLDNNLGDDAHRRAVASPDSTPHAKVSNALPEAVATQQIKTESIFMDAPSIRSGCIR